jgi:hypothetical protein
MDSAFSLISFFSEHSTSIWLAKKPNYERESEEQEYFDRCSTELMMDADRCGNCVGTWAPTAQ